MINSGAAATPVPDVTLTLTAVDYGSGVVAMRLSNDALEWEPWEPYVSTRSWTLIPGEGTRTVFAQFKDSYGNVSSTVQDSIHLGPFRPTCSITINDDAPFTKSITVSVKTTAESAYGDVTDIRLSNDGSSWDTWQPFDPSLHWDIETGDGTKTVYVQVKDVQEVESQPCTDSIILDTEPPTGAIIINAGDAYATSFNVTLALTAEDTLSGLTDMAFRENAGWTEWEPFANTRNWTLSSGDGDKSVGVRFRDAAGNYSVTASDLITVDTSPPVGSILINGGDIYTESTTVELAISATDAGIGVADMRLRTQGAQWPEWEPYAASRS